VGTHLYVANLGDSRVVLGTAARHGGGKGEKMVAVRLSREHNAGNPEVREELRSQHPHDPDIVKLSYGVWRVKGIIQVSLRSFFT
jgi:pyruvate dehydrogenase phosphatase